MERAAATIEEPAEIGAAPTPLTERVLAALPGPALPWMVLWAALFPIATEVLLRLEPPPSTLPRGLFAAANFLSAFLALWGVGRVGAHIRAVTPSLAALRTAEGEGAFARVESVWGPLVLALAPTALFFVPTFVRTPGAATAAGVALGYLAVVPWVTLAWTYLAILGSLNRLGGQTLRLASPERDRSLGLRPLGALAFTAFWVLIATELPFFLTGVTNVYSLVVDAALLAGIVGLLFLSLYRLHRQMVAVKAGHIAHAREQYAAAYRAATAVPRHAPQEVAAELAIAEAVERRAAAIQEWPLDEGVVARVAAIATSVLAAIVARLILSRFGL